MAHKAVYQVKREDLTDKEYARLSRLFEFIYRVKSRRKLLAESKVGEK